ncbi:GLPGLI family protein [Chryseobacterium piscicola]|uniref:GLPGLI family protein n=1 Tax=Chryseobacterium piscicola TaxID=551459 RepID=A0A1N7LVS5_9FLAO|nr:GLPGLI family protein [Chryseobacterium piscicola]PQA92507.1 hypothetical protein B0A70_10630 [Chryseobacterium piscicola]SIS77958.1 GLPGLI family protein [Chryseobacterium piscicola]
MSVKKTISTLLILTSIYHYSQTIEATYEHVYKNFDSNKSYTFKSEVYYNNIKKNKLFKIFYGINDDNTKIINPYIQGIPAVRSKIISTYILYSANDSISLIKDVIEKKEYILKDKIPKIKWKKRSLRKKINNLTLNSATAEFRGRIYTIWYDANSKICLAPWKFNNVPGLVYEIYDDRKMIFWNLTDLKTTDEEITNPFTDEMKASAIDYKNYPKIRFGLSERMKEMLKNDPSNKMTEQKRDGLEIKFEWEK